MAHGRPATAWFDVARAEHTPRAPSTSWSSASRGKRATPPKWGSYWRLATGCSPSASSTPAPSWCRSTPTCGPAPWAGPQEGRCRGGPHRLPHRPYRFERLRPLVPLGQGGGRAAGHRPGPRALQPRRAAAAQPPAGRPHRNLPRSGGHRRRRHGPPDVPASSGALANSKCPDQRLAASGLTGTKSPSSVSRASHKPSVAVTSKGVTP